MIFWVFRIFVITHGFLALRPLVKKRNYFSVNYRHNMNDVKRNINFYIISTKPTWNRKFYCGECRRPDTFGVRPGENGNGADRLRLRVLVDTTITGIPTTVVATGLRSIAARSLMKTLEISVIVRTYVIVKVRDILHVI